MSDDLGMAALDPNRAVSAPARATRIGTTWTGAVFVPDIAAATTPKPHAMTLVATVKPPAKVSRWRFSLFWCLLRLAARVYPFNFEIYREPLSWEKGDG